MKVYQRIKGVQHQKGTKTDGIVRYLVLQFWHLFSIFFHNIALLFSQTQVVGLKQLHLL